MDEEPDIFDYFLKKLDITRDEFYNIIFKKLGHRESLPEINKKAFDYLPIDRTLDELKQDIEKVFKTKVLI